MPYISTEEVKAIRDELKATFPNFKFSVVREHHSSVNVKILSGTIDFGTDVESKSVNHFWIQSSWEGAALKFLTKVDEIIGRENKIISEDGDYGSIPNYYYHISIGDWKKPYVLVSPKTVTSKTVTPKAETKKEFEPTGVSFPQDIEVVNYSEKAMAIFGDTKQIKEELKEIGAKFNPYLTKNGVKTAGWVISKSRTNLLDKLLEEKMLLTYAIL